jgi:uncharacterized membrane protein
MLTSLFPWASAIMWFVLGLIPLGVFLGVTGQTKAAVIFSTLDVPGSTLTLACGINGTGQIAGGYDHVGASGIRHGFLLSGGNYTLFNVPSSSLTNANGINISGQIVGSYIDAGNIRHGFLLSGGSYTTLDPPGGTNSVARGIDDSGQIVGQFNAGGTTHGFLATPVPEPASLTLVGIGMLSLIGYGCRRRKLA